MDAAVADPASACGQVIGDLSEVRKDDCGESWLVAGAAEQDDARCQHGRVGRSSPKLVSASTRIRLSRSATAMIC